MPYRTRRLLENLANSGGVERTRLTQCSRERATPLGELEALEDGVQVRTPAREPPAEVGDSSPVDCHHPEQVGSGRPNPTAHAGALRDVRDRPTGLGHATPSPGPVGSAAAPSLLDAGAG